jgi:uncharacterized membrane protein YbaN (DUF454 family)
MALGIGMVLLGITGLILPVMPGWVFLAPGLLLIGKNVPFIARFLVWVIEKLEPYVPAQYRRKVTRFRRAYRRATLRPRPSPAS